MAGLRIAVVFIACMLAFASASPIFFKPKHEHVVIHVPYKVHTHHHHHIEKIPIVKHVPIYKEVHVPIYKEIPYPVHIHHDHHHDHHDHHEEHHGWEHGGWW